MDYEALKQALRDMEPRTRLYEIVKAEMVRRGRWKRLPRGKNIKENIDK